MRIAIMSVASGPVAVAVLAVGLSLGAAGRARAGPLNPLDFASLGAFPTASGTYTINTSGTPTLTAPNGTTITGVVFNGTAVFDFDSINVVTGQSILGRGSLPAALLSRGGITVDGMVNFSAGSVSGNIFTSGGLPGPGGFPSGSGPGGGGAGGSAAFSYFVGGTTYSTVLFAGGGGGSFGGAGGAGGSVSFGPIPPVIPPLFAPGGGGGATYANLLSQLLGGGGGGTNGWGFNGSGGPGGGGGGAIELGAIGNVSISGSIRADGLGFGMANGLGGGAGGGILVHGDGVTLTGLLSADGGPGSPGGEFSPGHADVLVGGGGGGGGGQVVIDPMAGAFTDTGGTIDVARGAGGADGGFAGAPGLFSIVPEPTSLVMLGTGGLVLLGYGRCRHRRRATA
jgi:hypothetical protein